MRRDEIIRAAKDSGLLPIIDEDAFHGSRYPSTIQILQRFTEIIEAAERESCANLCEGTGDPYAGCEFADAIRSRSKKS